MKSIILILALLLSISSFAKKDGCENYASKYAMIAVIADLADEGIQIKDRNIGLESPPELVNVRPMTNHLLKKYEVTVLVEDKTQEYVVDRYYTAFIIKDGKKVVCSLAKRSMRISTSPN